MKKYLQVAGVVGLALLVFVAVGMGYLYWRQNSRYLVTSVSMMPTLHKKDMVEVDREAFRHRAPQKGEVVLFRNLEDQKFVLVGRVVGVPGDEISFSRRHLQVNGTGVYQNSKKIKVEMEGSPIELEEAIEALGPLTYSVWYHLDLPDMDYAPVKIQADQYFIMGDNRDNAKDSRYGGPIPRANLVGSVKRVIDAVDRTRVGKEVSP